MASYDNVRSAVLQGGVDARVEVNQRALIDKILARYASQGAVYRELLQNSNDAEAKNAQIRFTTTAPAGTGAARHVSQVVYQNDGLPFREADWSRLRNIAEGNPDVSKVGAFGVGAYTMFSICEEPLVISGDTALAFAWRGDSLWARSAPAPKPDPVWTTFVLPSRDPYPLPDIVPFAQFLCASLTFTNCLHTIRLIIDDQLVLTISKRTVEEPTIISPPRASSWFSNDGMITASPNAIFTLASADSAIKQSVVEITVLLDNHRHSVRARYISALANVRVPSDMQRRIERVTKKRPPPHVNLHIFVDATARSSPPSNRAAEVTEAFSPGMGAGHVFIGFRTSQTTGLAAHLAGPLIPTVEREAIDFQDRALKVYNSDLLVVAGILMRLTLEHAMSLVGARWEDTKAEREALERKMVLEAATMKVEAPPPEPAVKKPEKAKSGGDGLFSFVRFMTSGVKRIAEAITSGDVDISGEEDLLNPPDPRPLSDEERDAIMLMKAFSPQQSTPDQNVGVCIADGFVTCMPKQSPPVLTRSGVLRAADSRLPFYGIEQFVTKGVIRKVVFNNSKNFLKNVAGCRPLSILDLVNELRTRALTEEEFVRFVKWWVRFVRAQPGTSVALRQRLRENVKFIPCDVRNESTPGSENRQFCLADVLYFREDVLSSPTLPMPRSVLSLSIQQEISLRILRDGALREWFVPLPFRIWAGFIVNHACLKEGRKEDADVRLEVLTALSNEHSRLSGVDRARFEKWLHDALGKWPCVPYACPGQTEELTDLPSDLYLPDAEIGIFEGLGSFKKVSGSLKRAGVSNDFLVAIGARKAIAIDFLLTNLDNLKWNKDPEPLIRYLRTATLSQSDLENLRTNQYLPEAKDQSRTYSPEELHLPNDELSIFPFVKVLQWPVDLHERSANAAFLRKLGCKVDPPLGSVVKYIAEEVEDEEKLVMCLEFVAKRLGAGGVYLDEYSSYLSVKFLPAIRKDPLEDDEAVPERQSPSSCFSDAGALCMGFPVLDPKIDSGMSRLFAERFRCVSRPPTERLIHQLMNVVSHARRRSEEEVPLTETTILRITNALTLMFNYLSSKAGEMTTQDTAPLRELAFIPYRNGMAIEWYRHDEVYFQTSNDDIGRLLCKAIEFNAFLATVGVRSEPSPADLVNMVTSSPIRVLKSLGGEKYLALLRRLASYFEGSNITPKMRHSPFLVAYRLKDGDVVEAGMDESKEQDANTGKSEEVTARYCLAKAADICIIDNAFYARMFSVLTAPQELDLERFYESLGAEWITKRVRQEFQLRGRMISNTDVTRQLSSRLQERLPLLISPKITSRQLKADAARNLMAGNVTVQEVSNVIAKYSLRDVVKRNEVSCCAKLGRGDKCIIYVTANLDWFDVGNAIGRLILVRCMLEDAFFVGSILEAPLGQLRARGFPVDRILGNTADPETPETENQPVQPVHSGTRVSEKGLTSVETSVARAQHAPERHIGNQKESPVKRQMQGQQPSAKEQTPKDGYEQILQGMFPNCNSSYIRQLLGKDPSLNVLQEAADKLSDGNYPKQAENKKEDGKQPETSASETRGEAGAPQSNDKGGSSSFSDFKRIRDAGSSLFQRAFRPKPQSGESGGLAGFAQGSSASGSSKAPTSKTPASDAQTQQWLENMLDSAVKGTRAVSRTGVKGTSRALSPATPEVPQSVLNNSPDCDLSSEHDLESVEGPHLTGKTENGMRVFVTSNSQASFLFVQQNWTAIEQFSVVLRRLCLVFKVRTSCAAIYHEPTGRTIAFNANGSLYFNVRYFVNLHLNYVNDMRCYAYWFTTMAHELAHNVVHEHSREHGYFTESYITAYLPNLLSVTATNSN